LQVIEAQWELLLMPLISRLVNDPVPACRREVGKVAGSLLTRLPRACCDKLACFLEQWLTSDDADLRRTGAQVAAMLLQVYTLLPRSPLTPN
jgi:hypothetical protein